MVVSFMSVALLKSRFRKVVLKWHTPSRENSVVPALGTALVVYV